MLTVGHTVHYCVSATILLLSLLLGHEKAQFLNSCSFTLVLGDCGSVGSSANLFALLIYTGLLHSEAQRCSEKYAQE